MWSPSNRAPGVYWDEEFPKRITLLPTGVAGFVGLAGAKAQSGEPPVKFGKPVSLHHREDFDWYFTANDSYLAKAVNGFFLNGGVRCYVVPVAQQTAESLQDAVEALAPLPDLDLIAVPDAVKLSTNDLVAFQCWLLEHCARHGDRFAILDIPKGTSPGEYRPLLGTQADGTATSYGGLYHPWLRVNAGTDADSWSPPCGHVAGVYARSDARVGVFKAPANEEILGVFDLSIPIADSDQALLNSDGVNCIRSFPGRGIRVWGARTLSSDPQWRYVNVRRLFVTVRRWIDATMGWAVFEPDSPQLRTRIAREVETYLGKLWQSGALQGDAPEQAYFVRCDAETNPRGIQTGEIVTEIGLAPIVPAEFVVVRVVHRLATPADAGAM